MPQVIPQPLDQMSAGLSEEVSEQPASASANQSSVRVDTPYLTLREAALASGKLTGEQFDAWVRAEDMVRPG